MDAAAELAAASGRMGAKVGPVAPSMMIHTIIGEIQTVVATMRNNSRFSAFSHNNPLLRDFKGLRSVLANLQESAEVDMCVCLKPFLTVIRSEETSGPITGVALISVYKFIVYGFIDASSPSAAKAMAQIADTVTHCRFEVTNPDVDDVVLMKILRVLLACLCCPAGVLLTDDLVCEMVQTCYRMTTQGRICELLRKTAEHAIMEIVHVLFLIDRRHAHRVLEPAEGDLSAASIDGGGPAMATTYVNPQGVRFHRPGEESSLPQENKPYGKGALVRVFAFLCSLINPHDERHSESIHVLGLQLLISVVEAQADLIEETPAILSLVCNEMSKFLLQSLTTQSLDVMNLVMRLFFNLYIALRSHLKVQVEVFFSNLLAQILDNEALSFEMREVAMEHLVQFVSQPDFITDIYVNYDCHVHCTDLFVNLSKFLCKSSFPVEGVLYSTQLLSLEALLGILHTISKRCSSSEDSTTPSSSSRTLTAADLRHNREEKAKMLAAAEIFNRNVKECIAHLKATGVLPGTEEVDPVAFAHFLRHCPGLKKELVGEFIGGAKNTAILNAYLDTFDFTDVPLIASIRQYLTAFFFKGEGQALERILDAFSQRWVTNNPNDTYIGDADMACVLSYSIVILNVDAHNTQIKDKMTVAQYVKMWGHANKETSTVPDELLRQYYLDITQNEIKIHDDSPEGEVTSARWPALLRAAGKRGKFVRTSGADIDKDMFKIIGKWIVASLSAVWDNLNEAGLSLLLAGFRDCATIAAHHSLSDLFDTTVTHLCKFTTLLSSPSPPVKKAVAAFGTNWRAQLATKAVFAIAAEHGDNFREAWRYVLRCITTLHSMGLANDLVEDHETFEALKAKGGPKKVEESGSGGSMFSLFTGGWFSSEPVVEATPEDTEAEAAAAECVAACKLKALIDTSRVLQADSLVYLIKALRRESTNSQANQDFNEDVACFCLDLLTNIVLSNEHRVSFVWVLVYEHFTGLVQLAAKPQPLVEKAIVCLLLLCVHLVHREEVQAGVLNSLDLVLHLNAAVATAMAESTAIACSKLVSANVDFLDVSLPQSSAATAEALSESESQSEGKSERRSESSAVGESAATAAVDKNSEGERRVTGWAVVLGLLQSCAAHPLAHVRALAAVQTLLSNERNVRLVYGPSAFPLFLQTVKVFVARAPQLQGGRQAGPYTTSSPLLPRSHSPSPSGSAVSSGSSPALRGSSGGGHGGQGGRPLACRTLDALYFLFEHAETVPQPPPNGEELWTRLRLPAMRALCFFCADSRNEVRNYAMGTLQRALLCPYVGRLFPAGLRDCFTHVLFPLLRALLQPLAGPPQPSRSHDSHDETRVRAVTLLSKFLLQNLMPVTQLDDFHTKLWPEILDMIALYTKADQSGLLAETIPETLKNMLLIMFQSGAFQCTKTIGGVDVWTYSWTKINSFCPVLQNDESFRASLRSFQRPGGPAVGSGEAVSLVQTATQSPQPERRASEMARAPLLPDGGQAGAAVSLSSSAPNLAAGGGGSDGAILYQDCVVVGAPGSPTNI